MSHTATHWRREGFDVRVVPAGTVAAGGFAWRRGGGGLQLTLVVKAELQWVHGEDMVLAGAPRLLGRDRHYQDDPTRSLQAASDRVPFRPRADVWLTGHAHAPAGQAVPVGLVRLGIFQGSRALIDKVVHVYGSRGMPDARPEPFVTVPLVYERAYGGAGYDDNPVGVGADERPLLPNVLHPSQPERPAGFGPISRYWHQRRRLVTTEQRKLLEGRLPVMPDRFDWEYYQAAPVDQRCDYLAGDEWLVLDGADRELPRVQTRLPRMRGQARLVADEGHDSIAVAMVLDTLAIDADCRTCAVTWRGIVGVESEERMRRQLFAAGVEIDGRPIDWTEAYARLGQDGLDDPTPDPTEAASLPSVSLDSTATIVTAVPVSTGEIDLGATRVDPTTPAPEETLETFGDYEPTLRSAPPRYPRAEPDREETLTSVVGPPDLLAVEDHRATQADLVPPAVETDPSTARDRLSLDVAAPRDTLSDNGPPTGVGDIPTAGPSQPETRPAPPPLPPRPRRGSGPPRGPGGKGN